MWRWGAIAGCWLALACVLAGGLPSIDLLRTWTAWVTFGLVALTVTIVDSRQRAHRARESAAHDRRYAEARLETLRMRLDPHFLFNALNTISAYAERDPRTTRWMLDQLGRLLRMSLDRAREQETSLARELTFIDAYLALQKARFDDRFRVVTRIEQGVLGARVPSLILQPLVENAIRHGLEPTPHGGGMPGTPGTIEISAWDDGGLLRLVVRDDGPGLPANWHPEQAVGVGLSITRERLRLLYGNAQSFEIAGAPRAGVRVSLALPLRRAGDAAGAGRDEPAAAVRTDVAT